MGDVFVLLIIFLFHNGVLVQYQKMIFQIGINALIDQFNQIFHQINALIQIVIGILVHNHVNVVNLGQSGLMGDAKFNEIVEKIKYGLVMIAFANMDIVELVIYAKKIIKIIFVLITLYSME